MADLIFDDFMEELAKGNVDLNSDSFILILLDNTYTPDQTDHDYSDISGYELATADGYTAGGQELTESFAEASGTITFDAADVVWTTASFTARYAVVIDDTHPDDLLCFLFDFTEDKTGEGDNFTVRFHASGIFVGAPA